MDFRKLAEKIKGMDIEEELKFTINDNNTDNHYLDVEIILGAKVIREFDSTLAIIGAFGGGFNLIIWLEAEDITTITEHLEKEFEGIKLVNIDE